MMSWLPPAIAVLGWHSLLGELGAAVTLVISLALCGIHLRNDRDQPQPRPAKVGWR